jgi:hypothetical protein
MATSSFVCPKFNNSHANLATAWKMHKSDINNFLVASDLAGASDERKIAILLYSMGSQNRTAYDNFAFNPATDKTKFDKVVEKFDAFFEPKRVTKLYMKQFDDRHQREGET